MSSNFYIEIKVVEKRGLYGEKETVLAEDSTPCDGFREAANLWDEYLKWAGYDYKTKQQKRLS